MIIKDVTIHDPQVEELMKAPWIKFYGAYNVGTDKTALNFNVTTSQPHTEVFGYVQKVFNITDWEDAFTEYRLPAAFYNLSGGPADYWQSGNVRIKRVRKGAPSILMVTVTVNNDKIDKR